MNNREATRGRKSYQQDISESKGKDGNIILKRSIKHVQPSQRFVKAISIMLENTQKVIKKQREPRNKTFKGTLIWDSLRDGTYIKAKHGLIGSK